MGKNKDKAIKCDVNKRIVLSPVTEQELSKRRSAAYSIVL